MGGTKIFPTDFDHFHFWSETAGYGLCTVLWSSEIEETIFIIIVLIHLSRKSVLKKLNNPRQLRGRIWPKIGFRSLG